MNKSPDDMEVWEVKFQGTTYMLLGRQEVGYSMMTPEQFKEHRECDCGLSVLLNPPVGKDDRVSAGVGIHPGGGDWTIKNRYVVYI